MRIDLTLKWSRSSVGRDVRRFFVSISGLQVAVYLVLRYAVAGKQGAQARVLMSNFSCSALHILRCLNTFALIFLYACLEFFNELLTAIPRSSLVFPDAQGRRRVGALLIINMTSLHFNDGSSNTHLL